MKYRARRNLFAAVLHSRRALALGLALLALAAVPFVAQATASEDDDELLDPAQSSDVDMTAPGGEPVSRQRHSRLRQAERLTGEEAEEIYRLYAAALANAYQQAKVPEIAGFADWRRFNSVPYLSATHGNHYLNNYANEAARDYGKYEAAGEMPEGAVIAKDSFTLTRTREVLLGPLSVMVKMAPGFNYLTGDWKFMLIRSDGKLMGETGGEGGEDVEYCVSCHLAQEKQDYLFFIPKEARAAN